MTKSEQGRWQGTGRFGARLVVACVLVLMASAPGLAAERPNIVFILIDDQRFDAASALGHPFLETPHLDRLIERGVLFENAFVTTSLCSPSRASILTGQYAHRHGVLDNRTRLDPRTPTFPQELQGAGYRTAFVGKWHMGGTSDEPRPGFDRWVSFPGQGLYTNQTFNIDGERAPRQGYATDLITDYALDFLTRSEGAEEPFLLYVSHKAVHSPFQPAERHLGSYGDRRYPPPPTMANRHDNYEGGAGGLRRPELIVNLDFAPTFLEAAGLEIPSSVQGRSFLGLIDGDRAESSPWRDAFLYEYFWERSFPQTPTVLGVRTDRYKLMRFHGVWDRYELYDLEADPLERNNLLGDFITRHGAGNVETRLAVAARNARSQEGENAAEVLALKELFDRLSGRLDELLDETGALRELSWQARRASAAAATACAGAPAARRGRAPSRGSDRPVRGSAGCSGAGLAR